MFRCLIVAQFVVAMTIRPACAEDLLPFKITTQRENDCVEVKAEKDQATFSIRSPLGISRAVIERAGDKWPATVTLRLHLRGLESLKVTNGKVTLEAAVSSQDGKVRLSQDGKDDLSRDPKSPYCMTIRIVGNDGKPATVLPIKDGYFEMALPKAFFEGNPKSIAVNWIDFYRS